MIIFSNKEAPANVPTHHDAAAHSKIYQAPLQPKKKRKHVKWTTEEDAKVLKMRDEDDCSWKEIYEELSDRTPGMASSRRDGEDRRHETSRRPDTRVVPGPKPSPSAGSPSGRGGPESLLAWGSASRSL